MCLAVPMQVVGVLGNSKAIVEAEGLSRKVDISLLDEVATGDFLIIHAGFAIEKLDRKEADARLELFSEMARMDAAGADGDK